MESGRNGKPKENESERIGFHSGEYRCMRPLHVRLARICTCHVRIAGNAGLWKIIPIQNR